MRFILAAIVVLGLVASPYAEDFVLTDSTGRTNGPFEFKDGARISIAGKEYTISKVLTAEQKVIEKMKSIIIPELEFRQANIQDVLQFLQQASVDFGSAERSMRSRGLNIVHHLPTSSVMPNASPDPFLTDPFASLPAGQAPIPEIPQDGIPLVTFSARYVSLYEALNIVCQVCSLKWSVHDSVIKVEPADKKDDPKDKPGSKSQPVPAAAGAEKGK